MQRIAKVLKDIELNDGFNLDTFIKENSYEYLDELSTFIISLSDNEKLGLRYFFGAWEFVREYKAFEKEQRKRYSLKDYNRFIDRVVVKAKDVKAFTKDKPIILHFPIHKSVSAYNMQQAMMSLSIDKTIYTQFNAFLGLKERKVDVNKIVTLMKEHTGLFHRGKDVDTKKDQELFGMYII